MISFTNIRKKIIELNRYTFRFNYLESLNAIEWHRGITRGPFNRNLNPCDKIQILLNISTEIFKILWWIKDISDLYKQMIVELFLVVFYTVDITDLFFRWLVMPGFRGKCVAPTYLYTPQNHWKRKLSWR